MDFLNGNEIYTAHKGLKDRTKGLLGNQEIDEPLRGVCALCG